jgi:hypothetical protein
MLVEEARIETGVDSALVDNTTVKGVVVLLEVLGELVDRILVEEKTV